MIDDFRVGPSILMYHSVTEDSDDHCSVGVDAFRDQISWLGEHGFEVVSMPFLVGAIRSRSYKALRKKVVLTFDDGYRDFIDNALPILLEYRAPATVFLVTDMLGGSASWRNGESGARLMSEEEVYRIKAEGVGLGSHTATHANLPLLHLEEMLRQLRDSHKRLSLLGESFHAFSYPWGQWSNQVVEAVKAMGYECAAAVGGHMRVANVNTYLLPRITVTRDMGLKDFRSRLTRTSMEVEIRRRCRAVLDFGSGRRRSA